MASFGCVSLLLRFHWLLYDQIGRSDLIGLPTWDQEYSYNKGREESVEHAISELFGKQRDVQRCACDYAKRLKLKVFVKKRNAFCYLYDLFCPHACFFCHTLPIFSLAIAVALWHARLCQQDVWAFCEWKCRPSLTKSKRKKVSFLHDQQKLLSFHRLA